MRIIILRDMLASVILMVMDEKTSLRIIAILTSCILMMCQKYIFSDP